MVGIIIATHGEFAEGIKKSGSMIFGDQESVETVCFMPSEGPEELKNKLNNAIKALGTEEVLFLVDLFGGSPYNQASLIVEQNKEKYALVSGVNLPMLIESYGQRFSSESSHAIATAIATEGIGGVKTLPVELLKVSSNSGQAQSNAPTGSIPEGTVLGDGKIKLVHARLDSRLLHGQVATAWTKAVQPHRIIVVSDAVAKDDLRKGLIEGAAPPGVTAHVVPLEKMAKVMKDTRFGDTKAFLLFEKIEDVVKARELGIVFDELNVGSMAHSAGKVMVNNVLSMSQEDVDNFKKLKDDGVSFDVRKVPNDGKKDLFELINKTEGLKA